MRVRERERGKGDVTCPSTTVMFPPGPMATLFWRMANEIGGSRTKRFTIN